MSPRSSAQAISLSHRTKLKIPAHTSSTTQEYVANPIVRIRSIRPNALTWDVLLKQELVWSGWGVSGPGNAHGFHVCQYKGADHLCFFQGNQQKGYCRGHGIIMDNTYRIARSVQPGGGMASSDMHEFMPVNDGKSALMTVYQQRQFDMTPWNIKTGVGWVMESVFQEVDVETSKVLFEWRSLDHVDPSNSYTYPAHTDTSGTGLNVHEPWDYFHINSIDKNADGDYLISSRHTCAIYKISGQDGSVIWRLHGANPTFRNINFSFSQQHDARWLFENATHSVVSLYNNGFNGFNRTHSYSAGMIILIDHVENTALQIRDYRPFIHDLVSSSQGNLQRLPNKNAFIGWGNNRYVSEHDEAGNLVLWASFAGDPVMNYRAMKFEWDGNPTDSPALWTYARTADPYTPTTFYVSWNGATRVKSWRFFGSSNMTGPWTFLEETAKTGFETEYTNASFYAWTRAEAIGQTGQVLGRSEIKYTFVPSPELREFCQDESCSDAPGFGFPGEEQATAFIPPAGVNTVPWVDPDHDGAIWTYPSGFPHVTSPPRPAESWTSNPLSVWIVAGLLCFSAVGGSYYAYRYHERRQRLDPLDDQESAEPLNGMAERKGSFNPGELPWWNWKRYTGGDDGHYFPLSDRSPQHRRQRTE